MASATEKTVNKSDFVKDQLRRDPAATSTAVNRAWSDAGYAGRISPTLVSKVRGKVGAKGRLGRGPSTRGKGLRRPAAPGRGKGSPGKSGFIKEVLFDNPQANVHDVNQAWADAGFEGSISKTLVSRLRAELDLVGKPRGKARPGRKPFRKAATGVAKPARLKKLGRPSDRDRALAEIEGDIDRTIFKLMAVGGFERVEEELRRVRRLLVRSHEA